MPIQLTVGFFLFSLEYINIMLLLVVFLLQLFAVIKEVQKSSCKFEYLC